ncbi:ATP-binding cassette domain-containing protein [Agrobacterium vitis]|uniref:iron ABC transporter ATP-binding protein n=1 Tax=Rhizobium/Agrobacterium group TaxID=227290 RepID=UPI001F46EBAF|nr:MULTISPECIES: ATP-binding cassette domain-containing protein [Rhizobium/Agrobacterium group]MCF1501667.1 ATP-binding cassette domain-containing protein [Allorhizobium sp. Av2]MCM2438547.1 ATP-binding cassette domain-containing protein [Agrobacterium vitis]MCM2473116.1 ATP-binding cassette domain-containing protein [Rhizobium sp. CG5]
MISVRNLDKAYSSSLVLSDISATFPSRRLTSLIGPNGAGKSTLLMLIARLHLPTRGEILIEDKPITDFRLSDYAQKIATLRQSPIFNLRLTVEELVAFGRFPYSKGALNDKDRAQIEQALEFLSLDRLRKSYIDELSGGQRQLAFLAMTIAQETDYLLLDEPLNNLDMKHAVQIMRALRRLCDEQGRTAIMVVHDINFAANYSDHIVAMKHGSVRFSGPPSEVITEKNLRDLYDLEFEILKGEQSMLCNYFKPSGAIS